MAKLKIKKKKAGLKMKKTDKIEAAFPDSKFPKIRKGTTAYTK